MDYNATYYGHHSHPEFTTHHGHPESTAHHSHPEQSFSGSTLGNREILKRVQDDSGEFDNQKYGAL